MDSNEINNKFTQMIRDHLETIRNSFEYPDTMRIGIVIWDFNNPEDGYALTNASVEETMKELLYLSRSGELFSGSEQGKESIH